MPFVSKLLETAATDSSRVAIADAQSSLTYGELVSSAGSVNAAIEELLDERSREIGSTHDGGHDGDRHGSFEALQIPAEVGDIPVIAISLTRALDSAALVAKLACFKTVSVVLDPLWPIAHRVRSIVKSGARMLITDDHELSEALTDDAWPGATTSTEALHKLATKIGDPASEITASDITAPNITAPAVTAPAVTAPAVTAPAVREGAEPFTLIFTSGTTDEPKGFLRTRASWRVNIGVSTDYLYASEGTRSIAPGPLAYSLTLYALVEVLGTGGSLWLQSRFDAIEAVNLIEQKKIERLVCVPALLPALAASATRKSGALDSLTYTIVGGANLSEGIRTQFLTAAPNSNLLSYYGAAEIGFIGFSEDDDATLLNLFDGVSVSVRNDQGQPVAEGQIGTLYVRVASQGDRYISTAGATEITGSDGWSTVYDQARIVDNKLVLEGREGDIVLSGGHNISLPQIDRALQDTDGISHAIAVAIPDKNLGTVIAAVIESDAGQDKASLTKHLSTLLAPQYVPKRLYVAERLPKTVGGKIRRGETLEELLAGKYKRLV